MFYSLHRFPFYPGSGSKEETGTGAGLGFTLNNPIAYGTPRAQILAAFRLGLEQAAAKIRPEVIIVSAGFDAHIDDPLGSLDLYEDDFAAMTKMVTDVAACYCPGRILSCLEGGYELTALEACVRAHVRALEGT